MTVFDHMAIGRSAMRAFRLGMNIAGYNVANSQTPGFSRRRLELGTMPAVAVEGGQIGTGVDVVAVNRQRDPFLDFAARRELGRLGADSGRSDLLAALEPTLGEVDNAELQNAFSGFFDALQTLSVQPDSISVREAATGSAQQLAATLRRSDSKLVEARGRADKEVRRTAERVNDIAGRLASINAELIEQESGGDEASDLRDERDRLVDEIAQLVAVRSVETSNGTINLYLDETGDTLVSGTSARALTITSDASGHAQIGVSRGGEAVDLTTRLALGKIGGALQTRDQQIAGYRDALDQLAGALITTFNGVHRAGFDLDGQAGVALFTPDPPGSNAASAIQVNAVVEDDPRKWATSSVAGNVGNNQNALDLVALRQTAIAALGGRSLLDTAADVIGQVGHDVAQADAAREASQTIVDALDLKRQEVSGVNLDDEAADLVRWQQSFAAAAKFMQVVNQVTESALGLIGG